MKWIIALPDDPNIGQYRKILIGPLINQKHGIYRFDSLSSVHCRSTLLTTSFQPYKFLHMTRNEIVRESK